MIKALLVIASMGVSTEMADMDSCLSARDTILTQDSKVEVLCIPTNPKPSDAQKMDEMLGVFIKMIDIIREYEYLDRFEREEENDRLYRPEEDCKRPFGALECEG